MNINKEKLKNYFLEREDKNENSPLRFAVNTKQNKRQRKTTTVITVESFNTEREL